MTDNEKEFIEKIKDDNKGMLETNLHDIAIACDNDDLKMLLSIIEKQQKEIEALTTENTNLENGVYDLKNEIEKQDKIIDLIANRLLYNERGWHNKEEVKQYFKKEVK